jgi:Protein of unknown function (DUF3014)
MRRRRPATSWIIGSAVAVVVVVVFAAWWYFSHVPRFAMERQPAQPPAPVASAHAPPPIQHPISEASTGPAPAATAPLPSLDHSDSAVVNALEQLPGAKGLGDLLIAHVVIPHIVATVDALPRRAPLGTSIVPLRTPPGSFEVDQSGGHMVIAANNRSRYDAYMRIAKTVDPRALVAWYVRWYPLFQKAYRDLGYPHGYFNDRLIAAINDMLAAPNAQQPVALERGQNGRYLFADSTWESLSAGQKLMIRLGPENEREIKARLSTIRTALLGKAPALPSSAPASGASARPPASTGRGSRG